MALTHLVKVCAVIKGGTNSSAGNTPNDQESANARQIVLAIDGQTVSFFINDATNASGADALTVGSTSTITFS